MFVFLYYKVEYLNIYFLFLIHCRCQFTLQRDYRVLTGEIANDSLYTQVSQGMFQLIFITPELIIKNRKWRKLLESDIYSEGLKAHLWLMRPIV